MWSNEITVGRKEGMMHSQDLFCVSIMISFCNGRYVGDDKSM